MIFADALKWELDPGEHVEADDGYNRRHAPHYVRPPSCMGNPLAREDMQQRVRSCHETCNKHFKQWKILRDEYHHKLESHSDVYHAISAPFDHEWLDMN